MVCLTSWVYLMTYVICFHFQCYVINFKEHGYDNVAFITGSIKEKVSVVFTEVGTVTACYYYLAF